jgi:nicotinamidase-related amidase
MTMPELSSATTAVLVIDMQNDSIHVAGAFASTGAADHAEAQNVIRNVRTVLDAARAAGHPVFHNRIVVYPQRPVGWRQCTHLPHARSGVSEDRHLGRRDRRRAGRP